MRVLKVAIAGFGGVGRATASLLLSRRERYRRLYKYDVRLVAVCGSRSGLFDADGLEADRLDALQPGSTGPDFVASSGATVVIEAGPSDFRTGGPGLSYIRSALMDGRDAIVISKGALVHSGSELRALAKRSNARLKISGAAAAALPTIDLLDHSLLGCKVLKLEGILNATSNYLLDAMTARGIGFDEALREAQAGGFAEADPRNDTEGWDTAAKLVLIASFGLGLELTLDDVSVTGIQFLTPREIEAWRREGLVPKLIGSLIYDNESVRANVAVRTYQLADPLAHVSGKSKAVRFTTDAMGETVAISHGAEPLATAAAALKDLEQIILARGVPGQLSNSLP